MTRRIPGLVLTLALLTAADALAAPQVIMQTTPLPTVTAENTSWYLSGQPVSYAGSLYYPAGPQVFFNANEMVRSGFFDGIPLYTRTTIEPYSVVYVPLPGGRMQPYERPRTGALTGTAGSMPTSLPTPWSTVPPAGLMPQAAIAPASTTTSIDVQLPRPLVTPPMAPAPVAQAAPEPVGTSGAAAVRRPTHVSIGGKPQGTNSVFIEFEGRRWYPAGPAGVLDLSGMVRVGSYFDLDVFAVRGQSGEIYVPSSHGGTAVVRYTLARK